MTREKPAPIILSALGILFRLLSQFTADKSPYASVLYKTLTLALIENHLNTEIREFILNNFIQIFENFDTVPVSILMDPLIKQL